MSFNICSSNLLGFFFLGSVPKKDNQKEGM